MAPMPLKQSFVFSSLSLVAVVLTSCSSEEPTSDFATTPSAFFQPQPQGFQPGQPLQPRDKRFSKDVYYVYDSRNAQWNAFNSRSQFLYSLPQSATSSSVAETSGEPKVCFSNVGPLLHQSKSDCQSGKYAYSDTLVAHQRKRLLTVRSLSDSGEEIPQIYETGVSDVQVTDRSAAYLKNGQAVLATQEPSGQGGMQEVSRIPEVGNFKLSKTALVARHTDGRVTLLRTNGKETVLSDYLPQGVEIEDFDVSDHFLVLVTSGRGDHKRLDIYDLAEQSRIRGRERLRLVIAVPAQSYVVTNTYVAYTSSISATQGRVAPYLAVVGLDGRAIMTVKADMNAEFSDSMILYREFRNMPFIHFVAARKTDLASQNPNAQIRIGDEMAIVQEPDNSKVFKVIDRNGIKSNFNVTDPNTTLDSFEIRQDTVKTLKVL